MVAPVAVMPPAATFDITGGVLTSVVKVKSPETVEIPEVFVLRTR